MEETLKPRNATLMFDRASATQSSQDLTTSRVSRDGGDKVTTGGGRSRLAGEVSWPPGSCS